MSTLTSEQKQAINAPYLPPTRRRGQQIVYFENGKRDGWTQFAHVFKTGERFDTVQLMDGSVINAVAHIDDPKLKNAFVRDKGAWDHTEETREQDLEHEGFVKRLNALERALLAAKGASDRDFLLLQAKKFGLTAYSTLKSDELRSRVIAAAEAQESSDEQPSE